MEEKYKFKAVGRLKRRRFWERTLDKLGVELRKSGVTKKCFDEELLDLELVRKIYQRVRSCSQRELSYGNGEG